jgi:hypothetical protein
MHNYTTILLSLKTHISKIYEEKQFLNPCRAVPLCCVYACHSFHYFAANETCSCSKSWRWRFVIMFQGGAALYDQHVSLAPGDQAAATGRRGGLQVWNHFPRSSRGMCSGAVRQPHCTEWVYIHIERVACADKSPAAAYIFVTPVLASAPRKLSPLRALRFHAQAPMQLSNPITANLFCLTRKKAFIVFFITNGLKIYYEMLNYYHLKL